MINARTKSELEATAEAIRKYGVKVTPVAVNVTTEAWRSSRSLPGARHRGQQCRRSAARASAIGTARPDKAIDANMLTPIEFIKATVDGMMKRGFSRM